MRKRMTGTPAKLGTTPEVARPRASETRAQFLTGRQPVPLGEELRGDAEGDFARVIAAEGQAEKTTYRRSISATVVRNSELLVSVRKK